MLKNVLTALVTIVVLLVVFELSLFLVGLAYKARIDVEDPALPAETLRVLCLGESTTYGARVGQEHAYPALLGEELERLTGHDVRVYNHGVPGVTSTTILRHFEESLARFQPDLVILNMGHNDFSWSLAQQSSVRDSDLPMSWTRFLYQFRTYRLYKLIQDSRNPVNKPSRRSDGGEMVARYERSKTERQMHRDEEFMATATEQLDFNTRELIAVARRNEVPVLLVGYLSSRANAPMRRVSDDELVPWVDVGAEDPDRQLRSVDGWHPSVAGHRHIADRIAAVVGDQRLLD